MSSCTTAATCVAPPATEECARGRACRSGPLASSRTRRGGGGDGVRFRLRPDGVGARRRPRRRRRAAAHRSPCTRRPRAVLPRAATGRTGARRASVCDRDRIHRGRPRHPSGSYPPPGRPLARVVRGRGVVPCRRACPRAAATASRCGGSRLDRRPARDVRGGCCDRDARLRCRSVGLAAGRGPAPGSPSARSGRAACSSSPHRRGGASGRSAGQQGRLVAAPRLPACLVREPGIVLDCVRCRRDGRATTSERTIARCAPRRRS